MDCQYGLFSLFYQADLFRYYWFSQQVQAKLSAGNRVANVWLLLEQKLRLFPSIFRGQRTYLLTIFSASLYTSIYSSSDIKRKCVYVPESHWPGLSQRDIPDINGSSLPGPLTSSTSVVLSAPLLGTYYGQTQRDLYSN